MHDSTFKLERHTVDVITFGKSVISDGKLILYMFELRESNDLAMRLRFFLRGNFDVYFELLFKFIKLKFSDRSNL